MLCTDAVKNAHQACIVRASYFVAQAIGALIFLPQAGEVRVQLAIKVFPVAVPEREAHTKAENATHACINAIAQYPAQIFFRVI